MKKYLLLTSLITIFFVNIFYGGEVDVIKVRVKKTGNNIYRFSVTLKHADTGWKHFADRWEILDNNKNILATRVLQHPHVDEQPFTRSLGNVKISANITEVIVRGHDKKHGYGGKEYKVKLPK